MPTVQMEEALQRVVRKHHWSPHLRALKITPSCITQVERIMANDDWVADVRRWVNAGAPSHVASAPSPDDADDYALGYEAAHPALQAAYWPDAPRPAMTSPL